MGKIYGSFNKPYAAKLADNAAATITGLLDQFDYIENLDDYLTDEEINILRDAVDVLEYFDRAYTTDVRNGRRNA